MHVCDQNCTQRIYYDQYRTICRLSKRLFASEAAAMSEGPRWVGGWVGAPARALG